MGPPKKSQLDKAAWAWAESVDPNDVTDDHIQLAYRINVPKCKVGVCRRNCRGNPFCISGLGESKWLSEPKDDADDNEIDLEVRETSSFVGLKNLGATCYVNSLLQLWFHNLAFRKAIFKWNPIEDPEELAFMSNGDAGPQQPASVMGHLQLLFGLMQFGRRKQLDTSELIKALKLEPSMQQDAQEFSKLFISLLEDVLSRQSDLTVRNVISDNFQGEYSYITRCSKCMKESVSPSQFYELELNVKGHKTLHESISEFLKEEKMEGVNMYSCRYCMDKQEAIRFIRLKKLPSVLNLQLMRFIYDRQKKQKKKLNSLIQFPDTLDMSAYLKQPDPSSPLVYNLTAVLIHKGPSAYSGHYVAHICDQTSGTWYKFNDDVVLKMEGKKLKLGSEEEEDDGKKQKGTRLLKGHLGSCNAYMLVYTAANSDENKQPVTEEDLQPVVLEQIRRSNEEFETLVAETKEENDTRRANGRSIRAELSTLFQSMPVTSPDEVWEAISIKWILHWVSAAGQKVNPIDNTSLLCKHKRLDPSSAVNAKYISTLAATNLFEKYGGGPRLLSTEAVCRECVTAKCQSIRYKIRIADEAKEILNLLKQKPDEIANSGFWVGKESLRTWRRRATKMYIEKDDSKSYPQVASPDSGCEIVQPSSIEIPSCASPIEPQLKKLKVSEYFSSAKDIISRTEQRYNEINSEYLKADCQQDFNVLRSKWEKIGNALFEIIMSEDPSQSPAAHSTDSSSSTIHLNGKEGDDEVSEPKFKMRRINNEEHEPMDIEELRGDGQTSLKSDDEENCGDGEFNDDLICPHGDFTHDDSVRRLVPEGVWKILKSYFPDAKEFKSDFEPCSECQSQASKGKEERDMCRQQAIFQKEALSSLLMVRNRNTFTDGVYHAVSVADFLEPWRAFVRNAGRKAVISSISASSLVCSHGLLYYDPTNEEDNAQFALVSPNEWEILEVMFTIDHAITFTVDAAGTITSFTPALCEECARQRHESEQKALLQYNKAKVFIRQVGKSSSPANDEQEVTNNKAQEDERYARKRKKGAESTDVCQQLDNSIRRSTRHRRVRGEHVIDISSEETLKDLKVKIFQALLFAPFDQHLSTEDGRDLTDNAATLSSLNIFPNTVLYLKVDEPNEDTATPVEDFIRTTAPEEGFKGTILLKR